MCRSIRRKVCDNFKTPLGQFHQPPCVITPGASSTVDELRRPSGVDLLRIERSTFMGDLSPKLSSDAALSVSRLFD